MNYKELNEVLKDLLAFTRKQTPVEKLQTVNRSGYEDSYDERFEVYPSPFNKAVYIKVIYITDSYGNDERIKGIEFVSPIQKTVTSFEPLNN